jgi:hypothetical protein
MVQLSATRCSCIAILWVTLVSFSATNLLCCFSTSVYCCCLFRYRLSPETSGYILVYGMKIVTFVNSTAKVNKWDGNKIINPDMVSICIQVVVAYFKVLFGFCLEWRNSGLDSYASITQVYRVATSVFSVLEGTVSARPNITSWCN